MITIINNTSYENSYIINYELNNNNERVFNSRSLLGRDLGMLCNENKFY